MSKTKTCRKCQETKLISEFNKAKQGKFGVRGDCRNCQKIINRVLSKRYYWANRDRLLATWRGEYLDEKTLDTMQN